MTTERQSREPAFRRKPERPAEILLAAFEEFISKGFATTRLEDVAARAGVTKATIYFHFHSKENVFVQMIQELSKPMREKSQQFLDNAHDDGISFLESYLEFSYDQIINDRYSREILRLLISEGAHFPGLVDEYSKSVFMPAFERLRELLCADANSGKIRSAPALAFPDLMTSPVLALNVLLLLFSGRSDIDPKKHLEAAKDLLLNGLRNR